jgi:hypothetical protein
VVFLSSFTTKKHVVTFGRFGVKLNAGVAIYPWDRYKIVPWSDLGVSRAASLPRFCRSSQFARRILFRKAA